MNNDDKITKINVYIHRIKGRIQSAFMSFGLTKSIMVTTVSVLFAVTIPLVRLKLDGDITSANSMLEFITGLGAAVSALYTLFTLINEYKRRVSGTISFIDEDEKRKIKEKLELGSIEKNDGFEIGKFYNGESDEYYIESKRFNELLISGSDITYFEIKRKFELPDEVKPLVPAILERAFQGSNIIFNGKLIRQASHIDIAKRSVMIQKTDYFSGQCSHEIVYKQFISPGSIDVSFYGKKMLNSQNGTVYDLTRSPCANFIGVSVLVITRDNYIIIGEQAKHSKANQGRYAPSGSGSVDYSDIKRAEKYYGKAAEKLTFNDILTFAMIREFCEECNYSLKRASTTMRTVLTGYVRLIERGGKPDYFGICYIDEDIKNIQKSIRNSERGLVNEIHPIEFKNESEMLDKLKDFCLEHIKSKRISIQLYLIIQQLNDICIKGKLESTLDSLRSK